MTFRLGDKETLSDLADCCFCGVADWWTGAGGSRGEWGRSGGSGYRRPRKCGCDGDREMAVAGKGCHGVEAGIVCFVFHEGLELTVMQTSLETAEDKGTWVAQSVERPTSAQVMTHSSWVWVPHQALC